MMLQPSVYPAGTRAEAHAGVSSVSFLHVLSKSLLDIPIEEISSVKFTLDVGSTHVVEAIG